MEALSTVPRICCGVDAILLCVLFAMFPWPTHEARLTIFAAKNARGDASYIAGGSPRTKQELENLFYRVSLPPVGMPVGWGELPPVKVYTFPGVADDDVRLLHSLASNEQIEIIVSPVSGETLASASHSVSLLGTFGTRKDWLQRLGFPTAEDE